MELLVPIMFVKWGPSVFIYFENVYVAIGIYGSYNLATQNN